MQAIYTAFNLLLMRKLIDVWYCKSGIFELLKNLVMLSNLFTIVLILVCLCTWLIPVYAILKAWLASPNKVTIRSRKTGEIAHIDFSKDTDVDTLLHFTDVFLGIK